MTTQSTADPAIANGAPSSPAPEQPVPESNVPLFAQSEALDFRSRWEKIQTGFVDEPRNAVTASADELCWSAPSKTPRRGPLWLRDVKSSNRNGTKNKNSISTEDLT